MVRVDCIRDTCALGSCGRCGEVKEEVYDARAECASCCFVEGSFDDVGLSVDGTEFGPAGVGDKDVGFCVGVGGR